MTPRQRLRRASFGTMGESGQSTVEYAVVVAGFVAMLVGMGRLMGFLRSGALVEHAMAAASHNPGVSPGGVLDVLCF